MATKTKNPQKQVDQWNAKHPVGTSVVYRSHRDASGKRTETRSAAEVLGGHTAVVWLNDVAGCVALDALEVPANA